MAFSYTTDTPDGTRTGTEGIFAGMILKSGTWTAGGDVVGTIVTGLTKIIAHGTNVDTGTLTSEHTSKKNVVGAGTAANGSIGILVCATNNVGSWFAIGY
jgi:hypothetical protein